MKKLYLIVGISLMVLGAQKANAGWFRSLNPFSWNKWKKLNEQEKEENLFGAKFYLSMGAITGISAAAIIADRRDSPRIAMAAMAPCALLSLSSIVFPVRLSDKEKALKEAKTRWDQMRIIASSEYPVDAQAVPAQDIYSHQQNAKRAKVLRMSEKEKELELAKENWRTMHYKATWDRVDAQIVPAQDVYSHQQNVQRAKALPSR